MRPTKLLALTAALALVPMILPLSLAPLSPAQAAAWYDNDKTLLEQGKQQYNQGGFDQAIKLFSDSLKINPTRPDTYYWRGLALLAIKQNDRALADLSEAIRLAPDCAACYVSRGLLHSNMGQLDKAIADFDEALTLDPNLADARTNREFALKAQEEKKNALAQAQEKAQQKAQEQAQQIQIASNQPATGKTSTASASSTASQGSIRIASGSIDPKLLMMQKELDAKLAREKKEAEQAAAQRALVELKTRELALKEKQAEERMEKERNKREVEAARRIALGQPQIKGGKPGTTGASDGAGAGVGAAPAEKAEDGPMEITNRPVRDKWALIIGISNFQDPKLNLKYPAKDAQDFYDYLLKEGNFAADHVKLLTNEKATRANILSELGDKWLPRAANPDDLVLIFISSHGSSSDMDVGGVNYLLAYDSQVDSLYASGLPMQDLTRIIKGRVHSDRVVLVLDACHSGAVDPGAKGLFKTGNLDAAEVAQGTGQLVISSSQPSQVSWESKKYQNSVFTRCLIESLRAKGSATTLGEAFNGMKDRVQEEVLRERGVLQTPVLRSRWKGNDILLAAPPSSPRPGLSEVH
jgi:tetratricopeptide (TPR) repeat protein